MDNLDRDIREAQRLGYGVHYGRYKADHPHTREDPLDVARPMKLRTCKQCGKEYAYDRTNGLGYFCSKACKNAHYAKANAEAQRRCRLRLEEKACPVCEKSFKPGHRDQIYCGRNCAARAKNRLAGTMYTCAGCGKPFKPKAKTNKYCSLTCYNRTRGVKILCETEE